MLANPVEAKRSHTNRQVQDNRDPGQGRPGNCLLRGRRAHRPQSGHQDAYRRIFRTAGNAQDVLPGGPDRLSAAPEHRGCLRPRRRRRNAVYRHGIRRWAVAERHYQILSSAASPRQAHHHRADLLGSGLRAQPGSDPSRRKPANVIVRREPAILAKLLDFGIAKIQAMDMTKLTKTGDVLGSLHYVAPERLRGQRGDGRVICSPRA